MLKHAFRALGLAALWAALVLAPAASIFAQTKVVFKVTNANGAFVRSSPCWSGTKVASILARQSFTVTGRTPDNAWLRLIITGVGPEAWASASAGTLDGGLGSIPALPFDCGDGAGVNVGAQAAAAATPVPDTGPKLKFTVTNRSVYAREWPDTTAAPSASLFQNQTFTAVGRNMDGSWLAIRFTGKKNPIWVPAGAGTVQGDLFNLLPIETVTAAPVAPGITVPSLPEKARTLSPSFINVGGGSLTVTLGIKESPVPFSVPYNIRNIYQRGLKMGNRPDIFTKVGDCESAGNGFVRAFGLGTYEHILGDFGYLQGVIDRYQTASPRTDVENSFTYTGIAAHNGFTVWSVLDPRWAERGTCGGSEMPLACELRLTHPSIAIIMLGDADLHQMDMATFKQGLTHIVIYTLNSGTIPVLSTIPGHHYKLQQTEAFNWAITVIGQQYGVPVIDLKGAIQGLPNQGMAEDGFHMTVPPDDEMAGKFTQHYLESYVLTIRNLVSLQALDAIWKVLNSQ